MSEPVVARPLVAIGENRVGLGGLLEFLLSLLVALVAIGMVLKGQLAIRALDLLITGVFRHAEDLVVVPFTHAFATFTIAGRTSLSPRR